MCHTHGWRIVVVGCSERRLGLWRTRQSSDSRCGRYRLAATSSSNVPAFEMVGRKFRNLRQAVQRTHNAGITTEIVAEQELDDTQLRRADGRVAGVRRREHASDRGLLHESSTACCRADYPGIMLIIARDARARAGIPSVRDRRRRQRCHPGRAVAASRGAQRDRRTAEHRHDRGR